MFKRLPAISKSGAYVAFLPRLVSRLQWTRYLVVDRSTDLYMKAQKCRIPGTVVRRSTNRGLNPRAIVLACQWLGMNDCGGSGLA